MKRNRFSVVTLLGRASAVALAIGCGAGVAQVQKAFQGTPTVVSGSVSISQGAVAGTDTVSIFNSSTAIINWTPDDTSGTAPIDFLPQNNTVTFSGFSDFTVLNRILPVDGAGASVSRIIELNGTIQSQVNGSPGGSVWFYAPGGIVAGPTSVFNVGSLVLTSNDIDVTGGLFDSTTGAIRFRGATNVLSSVEVKPGASIEALSAGSYVALVAPRVIQGGTVKVNGTAAYVAAEAADISINGGLFDISISAGTTDSNGVVHTGKTELTDSATSSSAQRVYMVAVPKNNALTMLLSGDVGYAAASSVAQDGSTVVLAAGYDVTGGTYGSVNATATGKSNISIGASTWQPELNGAATGSITLRADQGQAITVGGDLNLTAGSGNTGGRIELLTFGGAGPTGNNGRIDVAGGLSLDVDAAGDGDFSSPLPSTGDAKAGDIVIAATGGSISAASLSASAFARSGVGSDRSGNATGGSISLSALTFNGASGAESGSLNFGDVSLQAGARTGYSFPSPGVGGNAAGGDIAIAATGGSITLGNLFVGASATGGDAAGLAGAGVGGNVTLSASAANGLRGNFSVSDCSFGCQIFANGLGGYGLNGAAGTGGKVLVYGSDADFTVIGDLRIEAAGIGGGADYYSSAPGRGGDGTGGTIDVESRLGSASNGVMRFGNLYLSADGASTENIEGPNYNNGDGGDGIGGATSILVAGGSLIADSISATASGIGGASDINCTSCGGDGLTPYLSGVGRGGSVQLLMTGGSADIGLLELVAHGAGGDAASSYDAATIASIAGQGFGGDATLDWRGGTLTAGSLLIDGSGYGGGGGRYAYEWNGASGADGIGGTARLLMADGGLGQITVQEDIVVRADGQGGRGADSESFTQTSYLAGNGGAGRGGAASVSLDGGALTAPSLFVSAQGVGGDGGENQGVGPGGAAGNGAGGTASLAYLSEGHFIDSLTVTADGVGGLAGSNRVFVGFDQNNAPIYAFGPGAGSAGGSGTGGTADLLIDVDPNFVSLDVSANGIGSAGSIGATGGAGGIGTGGIATLNIAFGATNVSSGLRVSAVGQGGAGGDGLDGMGGRGGDAIGGSATLGLAGLSTSLDANDISILAEAIGGTAGIGGLGQTPGVNGANGGAATGGAALFEIAAGASATTGTLFKLSGDAIGGAGSAGTTGTTGGLGGSGGDAAAGSATLRINGGRLRYATGLSVAPDYSISAVGMGGAGAAGGSGQSGGTGGNGGAGVGGLTSFEATDGDYLLGSLTITSNGIGGLGGVGGNGSTAPSPAGVDGLSSGGTAQLLNGGGALAAAAARQLASLSMTASGVQGGRIIFTDSSTGVGGGLAVTGDMILHATGSPVAGFTGIEFGASGNAVQVGGDADFLTEGPLKFAFSAGGGLTAGGSLTGYSGTGITLDHASRLPASYSLSGASIYLETPGTISLGGDSALQTGGLLTLLGNGVSAGLVSGGAALLNAGAGDLSVVDIAATGPITASGRNITIGSSGGMTIASAMGSGTVTLNATGLFTVTDRVFGADVSIGSGDIVIGPNAQVAASGLLRFRALNGQQAAIVGGADAAGGYSLSAAELGQVSASNLAIDSAGDMIVRDLTIGTAIIPGNAVASLSAAGLLRVEGALRLTGRTGQGGASLSAGEALQVIAGSGLIEVTDGNGALAGLLSLSAPSIQVASLSAIEDLSSLDSLLVKEARLAQNDGFVSEEGWLRAGTIHLSASDEIFVQNSGISSRFEDRRGLTANSLILSDAGGRPQIAINGRLALSTGEFATGLGMIPLVSIDGRYASLSKINGCLIATPGSCGSGNNGGTGGSDNRETLDRLLDPTVSIGRVFPLTLIQLRDLVTQGFPPLIDEPVTGAGNEDLWERHCGAEGEEACGAQ